MKKLFFIIIVFPFFNFLHGQSTNNPLNNSYKNLGNGPHVDKYINGQTRIKFTKVNGNVHGEHIGYYKNGKLREIEIFDNGRFNGVNFTLDENGDTLVVEKYRHDTLIFYRQRTFYKNRVCKSFQEAITFDINTINTFPDAKDQLLTNNVVYDVNKFLESGRVAISFKKYYKSGALKSEGRGINDKGKYSGPSTEYYENGKIASTSSYLNGQLTGEFIEYSTDGSIKRKLTYDKGTVVK
jgi:antitoxin component YwqK of YwqJK toxin-antitoxin module